jgi:hypothetical protein
LRERPKSEPKKVLEGRKVKKPFSIASQHTDEVSIFIKVRFSSDPNLSNQRIPYKAIRLKRVDTIEKTIEDTFGKLSAIRPT